LTWAGGTPQAARYRRLRPALASIIYRQLSFHQAIELLKHSRIGGTALCDFLQATEAGA
jgi:hypothetical protein